MEKVGFTNLKFLSKEDLKKRIEEDFMKASANERFWKDGKAHISWQPPLMKDLPNGIKTGDTTWTMPVTIPNTDCYKDCGKIQTATNIVVDKPQEYEIAIPIVIPRYLNDLITGLVHQKLEVYYNEDRLCFKGKQQVSYSRYEDEVTVSYCGKEKYQISIPIINEDYLDKLIVGLVHQGLEISYDEGKISFFDHYKEMITNI